MFWTYGSERVVRIDHLWNYSLGLDLSSLSMQYASDQPYKYSHPHHPSPPAVQVSLRLVQTMMAFLVFGVLLGSSSMCTSSGA